MSIEVRRLPPDEWEVWRDLRLRSLAESPDAFGSMLAREQAFTEAEWRDRMRSMPVVALVDGIPAALGGGYRIRPGWVQVVAMWTAPEFRRRGLGSLVLRAVVEAARAEGRQVRLDVARGNVAARAAYERAGFVATGETEPLREGSAVLVDSLVLP